MRLGANRQSPFRFAKKAPQILINTIVTPVFRHVKRSLLEGQHSAVSATGPSGEIKSERPCLMDDSTDDN